MGVLKRGTSWSLGGYEKENVLGKGKYVVSDMWREWRPEVWVSMILLWLGWAVLPRELLGGDTKCGIQKHPMCWEGWDEAFRGVGKGIPQPGGFPWDLFALSTTAGGRGSCRAAQLRIPQLPTDSARSLLPRTLKGKLAKQYPEAFSSE